MPSFFSNKKLIMLLTSLVILIALIGYSFRQGNRSSWIGRFARDTVGLFQYTVNVPAQYAAGLFENVDDMANAYRENKRLKSRLADYASVEQENRDLKQRNNDLKKQLGIEKDPNLSSYKKYAATVIGRSFDSWNRMLTVDKGRVNGIRSGMPVVSNGKLIGSIAKTGNFTSEVSLISNKQNVNQISAIIQNSNPRIYGMIEGYDQSKGVLLFQKIPIKSNVKKGQTVTTSGLSAMYPSGLLIGKVTSVSTDQYGLTKAAEVKPAVNLDDLMYVVIVEKLAKTSDAGE
ncbi:MAG: rod shape-determining protein MreC [Sporolactobacillus sp.]|nr:rod shape-determining protein MreC [Sporolactobacillus sp.]